MSFIWKVVLIYAAASVTVLGLLVLARDRFGTPDDWEYERCDDPTCPDREADR